MITVSNARKNYGDFVALDDVSLEIPSGSLTALLGPSGSGKSTLLRAIAGLEGLDSGVVSIGGVDVTREPPQKRGIGFVFQHYAAFKHMTVRDNVAFGLTIRKRPKAEVRRKVDELLEIVGLDGFQHRYPAQLSGGQRQRMALARALAVDPQVLLLDEPFGALDAKVRADLRHWLRRLHDEVHVTTVLVTHDQEEALDVADRIAVLNKGRIEQVGDPVSLYERPANDFVMSFLGSVARLGGQLVRPHDIVLDRDRAAALAVDARTAGSPGVVEAIVERVVRLGFEVRVELRARLRGAVRRPGDPRRGRPAALRAGRDGLRAGRAPGRRHRRGAGARDLRARHGIRPPWVPHVRGAVGRAPAAAAFRHTGRVDISARTEYAVRAMLALARAQAEAAGPLSVETLAQRQDLPRKFLEAIVADLRGAGLVVSTRGARGGYTLARPASEVSLGDVFRAVDGPLAEVRGLRPHETSYEGVAQHLPTVWVAVRVGPARGARRHQPRRGAQRRAAGGGAREGRLTGRLAQPLTSCPPRPVVGPGAEFWQNGRLYPSGRSTSCPPDRTPTPEHPAPRAIRARSRRAHQMKWSDHHRGRQDPTQAHGQDPCTVLPRRRHGLAHQARWPCDRGDRQVPPHRGALGHPDRQRARAVLAQQRRPADRGRRRAAEDHR